MVINNFYNVRVVGTYFPAQGEVAIAFLPEMVREAFQPRARGHAAGGVISETGLAGVPTEQGYNLKSSVEQHKPGAMQQPLLPKRGAAARVLRQPQPADPF